MSVNEVIEAAMRLSDNERREIAEALFESVDDPVDETDIDPEWAAEITRRVEGRKAGTCKVVSWEEVCRRLDGGGNGEVPR